MLFITFEGTEGSGKSTILKLVQEKLINDGVKVIATREPGGSTISEQIRRIILDNKNKNMDPWTEVLLYVAARRQHLIEKIFPLMTEDVIVLCDRFSDSTLAYQGYGRNLSIENINIIQKILFDDIKPNLTILFDLPPEMGLKRIENRKTEVKNRLDLEDLSFHKLVHEGYLKIAEANKQRIKIIDASKDKETVLTSVYELIKSKINRG